MAAFLPSASALTPPVPLPPPPNTGPAPLCLTSRAATICAACGGDLGYLLGGLVHVDTCPDCRDTPGRCSHPGQHKVCPDWREPEAAQCDHAGCHRDHSLDTWPCATGRRRCCGCCHGDDPLED